MTKIILNGCFGRMGKVVRALTENHPGVEIVAGVDTTTYADGLAFPTYAEFADCDMPADVVVDFSRIDRIHGLCQYGVARKIPLVICTTGLLPEHLQAIEAAAAQVAVFKSANMSLGINLLVNMVGRAAKLLYDAQFDMEIIEKHHNQKLDAPSGTALMLADAMNRALGGHMRIVTDRSASLAKRGRDELGVHALRGGTIVGEHEILFAGQDETLSFTHATHSRDVFAVGALKAAQFIKGKPPGLYTMQDLINEL